MVSGNAGQARSGDANRGRAPDLVQLDETFWGVSKWPVTIF